MTVNIIVAMSENGVIGDQNDLVWNIPSDLKRFKEITTGNTVIMGRKTHESIGRPLPNRDNIVITRNFDYESDGVYVADSLERALELADEDKGVFIIGGEQIYNLALELDVVDYIYLTKIYKRFEGDAHFRYNEDNFEVVDTQDESDDNYSFSYMLLKRKR